jgi:hypothetical protein
VTAAAIRASFRDQADNCAALGSPFTARLLRLLAEALSPDTPVGARVLGWPGDPAPKADALALRLAGGLHRLARTGARADLTAVYADPPDSDAVLLVPVLAALHDEAAFLQGWLDSAPQTNEVRRSVALIAAGHWLAAHHGLPLVLSELGASAGLNLIWDRYALIAGDRRLGPADAVLTLAPDWRGPPPPATPPVITARAGVDLNPLDPVADRDRLLAYLWPDQHDRIARTETALTEATRLRPPVARGDAVGWLEARLATRHPGQLHLIFHTVAWQYFPPAAQARGTALLAQAGGIATPDAPLARLGMEAGGDGPGAALTLTLWPGGQTIALGRVDFHGRWIDWQAPAP